MSEYSTQGRIDIDLTNGQCTITISYLNQINLLQNELYARILAQETLIKELERIEKIVLQIEGNTKVAKEQANKQQTH